MHPGVWRGFKQRRLVIGFSACSPPAPNPCSQPLCSCQTEPSKRPSLSHSPFQTHLRLPSTWGKDHRPQHPLWGLLIQLSPALSVHPLPAHPSPRRAPASKAVYPSVNNSYCCFIPPCLCGCCSLSLECPHPFCPPPQPSTSLFTLLIILFMCLLFHAAFPDFLRRADPGPFPYAHLLSHCHCD